MFHTPTRSKPKSPSETIPEINHIRHQAYGGWLHRHFRQQKRASLKPYTFRIISYRRVPVVRKFGTPPILDPDVTCRGNLIVENPSTPSSSSPRSFSDAKPACRPLTSFRDWTLAAKAPCKRSCHFPHYRKQNPRSGFCGAAAKPPALPMTWYPARPIASVTNAIFKAAPTRDSAGYPKP